MCSFMNLCIAIIYDRILQSDHLPITEKVGLENRCMAPFALIQTTLLAHGFPCKALRLHASSCGRLLQVGGDLFNNMQSMSLGLHSG